MLFTSSKNEVDLPAVPTLQGLSHSTDKVAAHERLLRLIFSENLFFSLSVEVEMFHFPHVIYCFDMC